MKYSLKTFSLALILTFMLTSMDISPVRTHTASALLPREQFLNPDGTIKLHSGYTGSLELIGYNILLDPVRGPVFRPLAQEFAPNQWSALGTGLNNQVRAIVIHGTDVYVGGFFTNVGGNPNLHYLAKWNGSVWSAVGPTLNGGVFAIATDGTDLYAAGTFQDVGGNPNVDMIAKWDGSSWSALGTSPTHWGASPLALGVSGTDVYAGGSFHHQDDDPFANGILRWNGSTWSAVGTGLGNVTPDVYAIAVNGTDVYVGGAFTSAGGNSNASHIAKWDGSTWSALGAGLNDTVNAIAINGTNVYVGGAFTDAGGNPNADHIAKWDGASWSALGTGLNRRVFSIAASGKNVYAGGYFLDAGSDTNADYIAKWNGTTWSALGTTPLNNQVIALTVSGTNIYAGGFFTDAGGNLNADHIAVYSDPVMVTVLSAGSQDGHIVESSETSDAGSTMDGTGITFRLGDTAAKKQYRGMLSFNTGSILPDNANIVSVKLRVKKESIFGIGDPLSIFEGLMLDLKKGVYGTIDLELSDFQALAGRTVGPFSPTLTNSWYTIDLPASAYSSINKLVSGAGLTQIRLRFNVDDNNDSRANYLSLYSANTVAQADRPRLIMMYTVP